MATQPAHTPLPFGQRDTLGDEGLFYLLVVANPVVVTVVAFTDSFFGLPPLAVCAVTVLASCLMLGLWLLLPPLVRVTELDRDGAVFAGRGGPKLRIVEVAHSTLPASRSRGFYRSHVVWGTAPTNADGGLVVYLTLQGSDGLKRVGVAFRTAADASAFGEVARTAVRASEGPYRT